MAISLLQFPLTERVVLRSSSPPSSLPSSGHTDMARPIQAVQTLLKHTVKMPCSLLMICRNPLPASDMQLQTEMNALMGTELYADPASYCHGSLFFFLSSSDGTYIIRCNQVPPRLLLNEVGESLTQISDPSLISFCL